LVRACRGDIFLEAAQRWDVTLAIREYCSDDLAELVELFRRSVREVASEDYSREQVLAWAPDQIDQTAWAAKRAAKPTWVAIVDDRIAGFSDLDASGRVDMLYVHPDFTRRGVATALLSKVESEALRQELARLFAEVSLTARPVFERCGFSLVEAQSVELRGQQFQNFRMQKDCRRG
jgi:putative acetyltransferase